MVCTLVYHLVWKLVHFHKVIVFIHCECDVCYKYIIGGPFRIQYLSISS